MAKKVIRYNHHGVDVSVFEDLKGRHRKHCLCWSCGKFFPDGRVLNCKIANTLFAICQMMGITTPVWECPDFIDKIDKE